MSCARCAADPRPEGFGNDRRCAFTADGAFTADNWNCATIQALVDQCDAQGRLTDVGGHDETLTVLRGRDYGGFVVLTRYKHRGRTSSAVLVGDFWPPRPLTLETADRWLTGTWWLLEEEDK